MDYARALLLTAGCLGWTITPAPAGNDREPADRTQRRAGSFIPARLRHIETPELRRMILERDDPGKSFSLVDLRSEASYAQGALPGAVNTPLKKLTFVAEKLFSPTEPIVLYGYSAQDKASVNAVVLLANKGYCNISFYDGGYAGWTAAASSEPTQTGALDEQK